MATWTNIPDSVLEPGKPARSVDALALRDNPIAIAEGAAGAPKIQTAGINNSAVTNVKINDVSWSKVTDRPTEQVQTYGSTYVLATGFSSSVVLRTFDLPANYVVTGINKDRIPGSTTDEYVSGLRAKLVRVVL